MKFLSAHAIGRITKKMTFKLVNVIFFVIAESLATRFALIYNLLRLSTLGLHRRLIKAIKS